MEEGGSGARGAGPPPPEDEVHWTNPTTLFHGGGDSRPASVPSSRSSSVLVALGVESSPTLAVRLGTPQPEPESRTGTDFGRYQNAVEIGRGGMGVVLGAYDPDLNRTIALKVLPHGREIRARELSKFLLEAQVTGQLEHPNIVPVHELGLTPEGAVYFAMKRVRGLSLADLLRGVAAGDARLEGAASRTRLLQVFLKICDAVAFAHATGVIHRDLKPANVMLGEYGEVLVMDWGLAKVRGAEDLRESSLRPAERGAASECAATLDGTVLGTPAYMPPEQAAGRIDEIDERSDVYSLGAILYEILALAPPYAAEDPWGVLYQVQQGRLVPPGRRSPERNVPRELDAVVLQAMARQPADRYQKVGDLAREIEAFLEGRILVAARYSPVQRMAKWIRRHRALGLATAAAALVAGLLVGLWAWNQSRRTADLEDAFARERREILADLETAERGLEAVAGAELVQPNGELRDAAVEEWFAAHTKAADLLDRLLALRDDAPSDGTRSSIEEERARERRFAICRNAWERATRLDLVPLARAWIGRAAESGLPATGRAQAQRWIDEERTRKVESDLERARSILEEAIDRELRWKPDRWLESAVTKMVRLRSPALVRLLLDPSCLESRHSLVRLVAVESLGKIGDGTTRAESGQDAVEALSARLVALSAEEDSRLATAIVEALASLGDPRAWRLLGEFAIPRETDGPIRKSILARLRDLPFDPELEDGGSRAPATADQFLARARLLRHKDRREEALADLDRALELDPASTDARLERGSLLLVLGRQPGALADLDRLVETLPDSAPARLERAEAHHAAKDWERARADCDRAIELDPGFAAAYHLRGQGLVEVGRAQEALADYKKALELDPRLADAHIQIGRLCRAAGRLDLALAEFNQAIATDPEHSSYGYLYRALAQEALGNRVAALQDYDACLRINGSHASAFLNRGRLHETEGRIARALLDYEACTRVDRRFWPGWLACGQTLARLDRADEARRALEEARSLAPADQKPAIEEILRRLR